MYLCGNGEDFLNTVIMTAEDIKAKMQLKTNMYDIATCKCLVLTLVKMITCLHMIMTLTFWGKSGKRKNLHIKLFCSYTPFTHSHL